MTSSTLGRLGRAASTAMQGGKLFVEDRVRRIINKPSKLDAQSLEPVVLSLGELKAVAMKIGQLASYMNPELRPELREALSALQTHSQPLPFDHVVHIVRDELGGSADVLLSTMQSTPVAAGSIGQVHRAETAEGRSVAVKVQYPGIRDAIARDFGPASMAARALGLFYPTARVELFGSEVRERLLAECDYEREARSQRQIRENFADDDDIVVPRVYGELSGPRVITSEWIDGVHLDRFLASEPPREARDRAGTAIYSFYYGSIFRFGLYNCDPHPGNTLFLPDGRVAMLDFGAAHHFPSQQVGELAALTHAIHCNHEGLMHDAMVGLGLVTENQKYDIGGAQELMTSLFGSML
ncbi:MAG: AarF/ABC1/UbiB kinase family protein, partial [Myxococcota bacterium]